VIFDYSRQRMIFEPNSSFGDPFKGNMTGIKVDPESDHTRGFEVVYVEDGLLRQKLDYRRATGLLKSEECRARF
jgi:hypothetical protein